MRSATTQSPGLRLSSQSKIKLYGVHDAYRHREPPNEFVCSLNVRLIRFISSLRSYRWGDARSLEQEVRGYVGRGPKHDVDEGSGAAAILSTERPPHEEASVAHRHSSPKQSPTSIRLSPTAAALFLTGSTDAKGTRMTRSG